MHFLFLCTHIHIYRYICLQISHGRSPPTVPPLEKLVAISVDVWRHKVALGLIAQHLHKSFHNKKILCNLLWNDVMRYGGFNLFAYFRCPKNWGQSGFKDVLLAVFYLGKLGRSGFNDVFYQFLIPWTSGQGGFQRCFRCPDIGEMIWQRCLGVS